MKISILNSVLTTGSFQQISESILHRAQSYRSAYVCVANVHMFIEAHRDKAFARVLDEADIVTPDGMPLVFALNVLYGIQQERVAGMDLMPRLLQEANRLDLKVYLYGSTPDVLTAILERTQHDFPTLNWAGVESPPFRELNTNEVQNTVERINSSGAHLVLVALGCPKQEKWMAGMKGKINATMVGLGGAFPVYAGMQSRAPGWMQRFSLEWFYRLMQEPSRLWKRYLLTNSLFILLLIKEFWQMRVLGQTHPSHP